MTATITRFEAAIAPCGRATDGTRTTTEDHLGLLTEEVSYECGCRTSREEFHDGSVHRTVVNHHGRVLVDEELRGE
ncbi:MAG: hypothetical protein HOQ22_18975 [Nocardioidaceae bacterium]|nr:hypothetical protein [Nocardioidaceae bacterium]NUS53108.1 hypothetical protein [Nocardioidaceae bacterium]